MDSEKGFSESLIWRPFTTIALFQKKKLKTTPVIFLALICLLILTYLIASWPKDEGVGTYLNSKDEVSLEIKNQENKTANIVEVVKVVTQEVITEKIIETTSQSTPALTSTMTSGPTTSLEPLVVPPPIAPNPPPEPRVYGTVNIIPGKQNIFYVETACVFNASKTPTGGLEGGVALNYRHACSIYSTAVRHPERPVHIIHTCPLASDYYERSSEPIKRLLELSNVRVVQIGNDPGVWFKGSILDGFEKKLVQSDFKMVHVSDALRMFLLWKYGGQYLDLDAISLRNLTDLGEDWIGPENNRMLNNAIMNFGISGKGHEMAEALLKKMVEIYDPHDWFTIGPGLLSSLVSEKCGINYTEDFSEVGKRTCGVMIYSKDVVFPLHPGIGQFFYQKGGWDAIKSFLTKGYTLHYWNTTFGYLKVEIGSPFDMIANAFCPLLYRAAGDQF